MVTTCTGRAPCGCDDYKLLEASSKGKLIECLRSVPESGTVLVSLDVLALFTNVLVGFTVKVSHKWLSMHISMQCCQLSCIVLTHHASALSPINVFPSPQLSHVTYRWRISMQFSAELFTCLLQHTNVASQHSLFILTG